MAKCTNCAAPLQPHTLICSYCGCKNDMDLKGIHHYTTHELESHRICPRCNKKLKTIDLKIKGKFLIERCDDCFGMFFDPGELESLIEASVSNVYDIKYKQLDNLNKAFRNKDFSVSYIKCPACGKIMNRVNFGTKSGVIVDRCTVHGVWLDGGELMHLFEWVKAGGKLLHQEKLDQQKKIRERKKRQAESKKLSQQAKSNSYTSFNAYGATLRSQDASLFDFVKKAAKHFLS